MTVSTNKIIKEIKTLPLSQQLLVVEEIIKAVKLENQLAYAVNELMDDYKTDKKLTEFTLIDYENFYETK